MLNALYRVQSTFGFFTSCAFAIAAIIAVLSVIPIPTPTSQPSASILVRNVQVVKGRPHYYSNKREEYAQIRFDLDADLSGLFTWNTKQVFVYVTANYPNAGQHIGGATNEAVIWDMIISATASPYSWANLRARYFPDKAVKSGKAKKTTASTKELVKPGVLNLKNQKPKYSITDPSGVISERSNATLQVSWNVQPWVGALMWDTGYLGSRVGSWDAGKVGRSETFEFPPLKGKATNVVKDPDGPRTPEAGSASPVVDV